MCVDGGKKAVRDSSRARTSVGATMDRPLHATEKTVRKRRTALHIQISPLLSAAITALRTLRTTVEVPALVVFCMERMVMPSFGKLA